MSSLVPQKATGMIPGRDNQKSSLPISASHKSLRSSTKSRLMWDPKAKSTALGMVPRPGFLHQEEKTQWEQEQTWSSRGESGSK